jgi:hypothetical protein
MNESEHKTRGRYVLEQVLPVLLNDGLYNKNEDIAKFSLNTISKLFTLSNKTLMKYKSGMAF